MGLQQDGVFGILTPKADEYAALPGQVCLKAQSLKSLQHPLGCFLGIAGGAVNAQKGSGLLYGKISICGFHIHQPHF